VGASQVTALLRRVSEPSVSAEYEVNIRAWLTGSYWVRLADPVEVTPNLRSRLEAASKLDDQDWLELASDFRRDVDRAIDEQDMRLLL
jgi:hypothetical protein